MSDDQHNTSMASARAFFVAQAREIGALKAWNGRLHAVVQEASKGPNLPLPTIVLEWANGLKEKAQSALKPERGDDALGRSEANRSAFQMARYMLFGKRGSPGRSLPWGVLPVDVDFETPSGTVTAKVPAATDFQVSIAKHPTEHVFGVLALAHLTDGGPAASCHISLSAADIDDLIGALELARDDIRNINAALLEPEPW